MFLSRLAPDSPDVVFRKVGRRSSIDSSGLRRRVRNFMSAALTRCDVTTSRYALLLETKIARNADRKRPGARRVHPLHW